MPEYTEAEFALTEGSALALDLNRTVWPWHDFLGAMEVALKRHPLGLFLQQYNCAHCGARQTITTQPNAAFVEGRCGECHEVTDCRVHGSFLIGFATTTPEQREKMLAAIASVM